MDIQLKRGLIEVCVLAALCRGESYGYALIREISECVEISESTLYPILKRLEAASMLTVRSGEHNGRLRKYYAITDEGRKRVQAFAHEKREMLRIFQFIEQKKGELPHDKT